MATAALAAMLFTAVAQASFGIDTFKVATTSEDGSVDFQAGSHPHELSLEFSMNRDGDGPPEGTLRSLAVELPPGLVGNPRALPRCSRADFDAGLSTSCPGDTQVGVADVDIGAAEIFHVGVYNLSPSPDSPVTLGLSVDNNNVLLNASLRSGSDYGVTAVDLTVPTKVEIRSVTARIWGVPMDEAHDPERICLLDPGGEPTFGCSSEAAPAPFLTLPTSCAGPLRTILRVDSVENLGAFQSKTVESLDSGEVLVPTGLEGCNALEFEPTIASRPTTDLADSPTGLDFNLHLPQNDDPDDFAGAQLKETEVALPAGVALNPSAAAGLQACSEQQVGYLPQAPGVRFSAAPQSCPDAAKVGTARIVTPLLDEPLQGAVYLAKQGDNPFGSLLALYVAVENPLRGVAVKLAGRVEPDPRSGQLTIVFAEIPQLPFEDLSLDFFAGPRAIFTSPPLCGTYATTTALTPWSVPEGAIATPSGSFAIGAVPGGGPCAATEAQQANAPVYEAGTLSPVAGARSPFVLRLKRENGSQRLRSFSVTLPPGVAGRVAGLRECSAVQIAAAMGRGSLGEGALEQAGPSCPTASEVGPVTIGAGAGAPVYLRGRAYLAGPYRGAPLSLAILTPAVIGPFDLGTVVVRAALFVDPRTAQLTVSTDPFPAILHGIPLDIRSIAVDLGRPRLIRNPTSCDPMAVSGASTSFAGQTTSLLRRFQVGGCRRLGFKPRLSLRLLGSTHRSAHPRLRMALKAREGDAGIGRVGLTLPLTELLESAHIEAVCSRAEFSARACPRGSAYGHAKVWSPLLDEPLTGPVYLRESKRKLPDLVASLDGRIRLNLVGRIDSTQGRLRVAFEGLPDVPLSKLVLTMQGGAKGLLVNTGGLCARQRRASAGFRGQNGKLHDVNPVLRTDCG